MYKLSIDTGFGTDDIAYLNNDKLQYFKYISVYAKAPADAEDMPLFEGERYYIGEEALMEDSEDIINVIDYKTHEKMAPLSIWNALNKLGLTDKDIDTLYIGLSLAQKDYAKIFLKRVSKFKVNNVTYDFTGKIKLVPQAVGAKYAIDHFYYDGSHKKNYAICDIGQLTVDVVTVIKGQVRSENVSGTSNEGIIKIIQQIQEYIAKEYSEIISVKEAQEVLISKKYNLFGEKDMTEVIEKFKNEYTLYIINMLKKRYRNIFKKYPKIYFVGGGAYYINFDILSDIDGISLDTFEIPSDSEFYNAIGNLYIPE